VNFKYYTIIKLTFKKRRWKMQLKRSILIKSAVLIVMIAILPACDLFKAGNSGLTVDERAQTMIAETLAVDHHIQTVVAETLAASGGGEVSSPGTMEPGLAPTETTTPTITLTATQTLTPTPDKPMVSVSVDTNCRTGPGKQYDLIGALLVGEKADVVGESTEGGYWIIKNPDRAGECWLWGYYASVTGRTEGLVRYTPPPTPTPTYEWTGTWTTSFGVPSMMHETIVFTLTQTGTNVTGSFNFGTDIVTLSGTLSADKRTLSGTWTSLPSSGPFAFYLVSANQFTGNKDDRAYEWCGYRADAGLPSPCMGP